MARLRRSCGGGHRTGNTVVLLAGAAVVLLAAGCAATTATRGSASPKHSPGTSAAASPTKTEQAIVSAAFPSPAAHRDSSGTVWLCRPGLAGDPCAGNLSVNAESPSGALHTTRIRVPTRAVTKKADCFYVYPTVSGETTPNANLEIQPAEEGAAEEQVAQFSRDCDVWAPMYRQVTVNGLFHPTDAAKQWRVAARSAMRAFEDYLHHFNRGRPVVLIGHSQGAAMVIDLLRKTMDDNPALRKLLVSAVILGGNVTVPDGKLVGGTFRNIPLCTSPAEDGCVIAYSSFLTTPPANTLFGKPGTGVSALSGQSASAGLHVACTNPADLGGTSVATVLPIFHGGTGTTSEVPFVEYPGLYSAQCRHANGTTWLQVDVHDIAGDVRPKVTESLGPSWGLHLFDVNITLGNLVADVHREIGAYRG